MRALQSEWLGRHPMFKSITDRTQLEMLSFGVTAVELPPGYSLYLNPNALYMVLAGVCALCPLRPVHPYPTFTAQLGGSPGLASVRLASLLPTPRHPTVPVPVSPQCHSLSPQSATPRHPAVPLPVIPQCAFVW
jgi:hypothetical protein